MPALVTVTAQLIMSTACATPVGWATTALTVRRANCVEHQTQFWFLVLFSHWSVFSTCGGAGACPRGNAYIDTPVGDLDYDNQLRTGGFSALNPMQLRAGAWERYPSQKYGGNAYAGDAFFDGEEHVRDGEAHFYMECSNRGICDRSTGMCSCFAGYVAEGAARYLGGSS